MKIKKKGSPLLLINPSFVKESFIACVETSVCVGGIVELLGLAAKAGAAETSKASDKAETVKTFFILKHSFYFFNTTVLLHALLNLSKEFYVKDL
ncbi:hypothetical protein [Bacillus glycinifermentans]|uniref:hypothetical protein n=1 Tax=Bacillus glycinifermentans TaxID=1664069 RepID=UPI00398ADE66